jgi:hypothetical protein
MQLIVAVEMMEDTGGFKRDCLGWRSRLRSIVQHKEDRDMTASQVDYSGLKALLSPENSVLALIDHQGFQFANSISGRSRRPRNGAMAAGSGGCRAPLASPSFLEPRHCGGDIDRAATQLGDQTVVQR